MSDVRPIAHDPRWNDGFTAAQRSIAQILGVGPDAVHHIGSTSVPGIYAKPVIDILVEVDDLSAVDARANEMASAGLEAKGEYGIPGRRYFRKNSADGVRTHHVHVFLAGSDQVLRHLAFRDFLRAHPGKALEYSRIKEQVLVDWAGGAEYIQAKSAFLEETTRMALEWYSAQQAD